jgi:hypothetical protein
MLLRAKRDTHETRIVKSDQNTQDNFSAVPVRGLLYLYRPHSLRKTARVGMGRVNAVAMTIDLPV